MIRTTHDKFILRDIQLEIDTGTLIDFGHQYLGASWNEAYLRWKYTQNPAGQAVGSCAEIQGRQVGFYSDIPVRLKFDHRTQLGAQAVDSIVAPEARRNKLFISMANRNYQSLDERGFLLDYAFPNPVSEAGFINRLGWQAVGRVPRYIRVLDKAAFAKEEQTSGAKKYVRRAFVALMPNKRLSRGWPQAEGLQVREIDRFDERIDDFWQRASVDFPIAVYKDAVYLNWRYAQNPLNKYSTFVATRGSDIVGFVVLSFRDFEAQKTAALAEFIVIPGDAVAGATLLNEAERIARKKGCAQLQCWMLPQHSFYVNLLHASGFVYWPHHFVPGIFRYTTPFIIRTHPTIPIQPDPAQLSNWFLAMGDHDYY